MSDETAPSVAPKPALMAPFAAPFSRWERAVAGRYLMARRKEAGVALIAIIAFVGTILAVATLIIVMSVMNGFRAELLSRILGFNGHLYVSGSVLDNANRDRAVARIKAVPQVTQAIPMIESQAMVVGSGQIRGAMVRGISPADTRATKVVWDTIKPGGDPNAFGQGEYGGDVVFIGARLAEALAVRPGDAITIISPSGAATAFGTAPHQKDYIVGGIFEVGMSQFDEVYIYMPLAQAQEFFGRGTSVDVIEVKVADPDQAVAMKPLIKAALGDSAYIEDWTQRNQAFFNALVVERNTMGLVLALLIIVAALNIVSGLLMLVKNKGRDIAILRTMGASRGAILRIFVMDGAAVGAAGALAGLALGTLFCLNIEAIQQLVERLTSTSVFNADVYFLSHIPARVEWSEVAVIVAGSFIASLIATLLPAYWGSKLDPVEALRFE